MAHFTTTFASPIAAARPRAVSVGFGCIICLLGGQIKWPSALSGATDGFASLVVSAEKRASIIFTQTLNLLRYQLFNRRVSRSLRTRCITEKFLSAPRDGSGATTLRTRSSSRGPSARRRLSPSQLTGLETELPIYISSWAATFTTCFRVSGAGTAVRILSLISSFSRALVNASRVIVSAKGSAAEW